MVVRRPQGLDRDAGLSALEGGLGGTAPPPFQCIPGAGDAPPTHQHSHRGGGGGLVVHQPPGTATGIGWPVTAGVAGAPLGHFLTRQKTDQITAEGPAQGSAPGGGWGWVSVQVMNEGQGKPHQWTRVRGDRQSHG